MTGTRTRIGAAPAGDVAGGSRRRLPRPAPAASGARAGLMPAARRPGSGTPVGRPAPGDGNTDEHAAGPAGWPRGRPGPRSAGRGVVVLRPAARVDRLVRVAAQGGGVAPLFQTWLRACQ